MENSKAYSSFIEQISAFGRQKMEGYYPLTLERIYDWERDEIEDIIWETFNQRNDTALATFLPKLKKYNGLKALEDKLAKSVIPSYDSVNIAMVLYEVKGEKKYLDILIKNYKRSGDKLPIISQLCYLAKSANVLAFLTEVYINSSESVIRTCALNGILWAKGYITKLDDINQVIQKKEFINLFRNENLQERKEMVRRLEEGEFEKYKT